MRLSNLMLVCALTVVASACATSKVGPYDDVDVVFSGSDTVAITRAEAADLLVHELRLARRITCVSACGSNSDVRLASETAASSAPPLPCDSLRSPRFGSVGFAVCAGIRGLEVRPDGRFEPDRVLSRSEWALALDDLARRLGVVASAERGVRPQFTDLTADHFARVAAENTVVLGLLAPRADGRFDPSAALSRRAARKSVRLLAERVAAK